MANEQDSTPRLSDVTAFLAGQSNYYQLQAAQGLPIAWDGGIVAGLDAVDRNRAGANPWWGPVPEPAPTAPTLTTAQLDDLLLAVHHYGRSRRYQGHAEALGRIRIAERHHLAASRAWQRVADALGRDDDVPELSDYHPYLQGSIGVVDEDIPAGTAVRLAEGGHVLPVQRTSPDMGNVTPIVKVVQTSFHQRALPDHSLQFVRRNDSGHLEIGLVMPYASQAWFGADDEAAYDAHQVTLVFDAEQEKQLRIDFLRETAITFPAPTSSWGEFTAYGLVRPDGTVEPVPEQEAPIYAALFTTKGDDTEQASFDGGATWHAADPDDDDEPAVAEAQPFTCLTQEAAQALAQAAGHYGNLRAKAMAAPFNQRPALLIEAESCLAGIHAALGLVK